MGGGAAGTGRGALDATRPKGGTAGGGGRATSMPQVACGLDGGFRALVGWVTLRWQQVAGHAPPAGKAWTAECIEVVCRILNTPSAGRAQPPLSQKGGMGLQWCRDAQPSVLWAWAAVGDVHGVPSRPLLPAVHVWRADFWGLRAEVYRV